MSKVEQANEIVAGFSLDDKISVVTGAGSGMGRASALTFAAAGAVVYALDIDESALDSLAEDAKHVRGSIIPCAVDATTDERLRSLARRIEAEYGRLDVLFNHAGRACAPGTEITNADWLVASDLNLRVPIMLTSELLPLLRKSKTASYVLGE